MSILRSLLGWMSTDCAVVMTGRSFWFACRDESVAPFEIPAVVAGVRGARTDFEPRYYGEEALAMKGRTPEPLVVRPALREGWVDDSFATEHLLTEGLRRCHGGRGQCCHPRVLLAARGNGRAAGSAAQEALVRAGARSVYALPYCLGCGFGAGMNMAEPRVRAVLAIEKDWFEFAALSMCGTLCRVDRAVGIDSILCDIRCHLRDVHELLPAAEELRRRLMEGGLADGGGIRGWEAWTGQVATGRPKQATVDGAALTTGAAPSIVRIAEEIKVCLLDLTPDQLDELGAGGVLLCGEGAAVPGLAPLLTRRIGIDVNPCPETPHPAVAGMKDLLNRLDTVGPALRNSVE